MRVIVPYTDSDPKSRLASLLSASERRSFARAMLRDVVDAVRDAGHDPTVLTTGSLSAADVPTVVDDRPLTPAVNAALGEFFDADGADELAVVMADLALATPGAVRRLANAGGDVVVAPGRGGGTNALVVRDPAFRVDYHGASYLDHRRIAESVGASVGVVDSMRLSTDVDEPADLAEVLLHGRGESRAWLVDAGFELDASDGRVGVARDR
jgi:2-phospho-L-lactate guanylyltransferase